MVDTMADPQDAPNKFDAISDRLFTELSHLNKLWSEFVYLYGDSPERTEFLGRTGKWFFATIQRLMIRELILASSRLTDPLETGRRRNLTPEALLADPRLTPELASELRSDFARAQSIAGPIRKNRNKAIAHLDHVVALDKTILPKIPRATMEELIPLLESIHRRHREATMKAGPSYEIAALGSAAAIVKRLEEAEEHRKGRSR